MTRQVGAVSFLLLDDDPLFLRTWARYARANGVSLFTVETPDAVHELLKSEPTIQAVLCDFSLQKVAENLTSEHLVRELHDAGVAVAVLTGDIDGAKGALGELVPIYEKARASTVLDAFDPEVGWRFE